MSDPNCPACAKVRTLLKAAHLEFHELIVNGIDEPEIVTGGRRFGTDPDLGELTQFISNLLEISLPVIVETCPQGRPMTIERPDRTQKTSFSWNQSFSWNHNQKTSFSWNHNQ